jgi:hypothetical protein
MKYTGPAKPIPTVRRSWTGALKRIVYVIGLIVLFILAVAYDH